VTDVAAAESDLPSTKLFRFTSQVPRAFAVADAGQIINPDGLANQIEGGIIQSAKPLAVVGIECATDVDRRSNKGTPHDVVIRRKNRDPDAE
jgi:Molybdopterin-binding domain of aldehyde dehydrogenase